MRNFIHFKTPKGCTPPGIGQIVKCWDGKYFIPCARIRSDLYIKLWVDQWVKNAMKQYEQ